MILIQEYYEPINQERLLEIRETLYHNLKNESIDKIYLLNEKYYDYINDLQHDKIIQIVTGSRLTFKKAFEYYNSITNDANNIVMISNNDIYIDPADKESIECIKYVLLDNPNTVIALSRKDTVTKSSQDSWIFKGPIKIPERSDFNFGTMGCDNKIAYQLKEKGYRLRNLPHDIITLHNHKSNFRSYNKDNVLPGPHLFVDIERIKKPITILNETTVIITYLKCG